MLSVIIFFRDIITSNNSMKVNQLKALFQKNGAIQTQMPPPLKNLPQPSKIVFHPQQHIQVKPDNNVPIIIEPEVNVEQPQPIPTQKPIMKNIDFLSELNKKLQEKSVRSKVAEEQVQQQIIPKRFELPQLTQYNHKQIKGHFDQIIIPDDEPQQEQMNFDDIMINAQRQSVFKSTLKARLGINERNPINKEEEQLFTEWQIQRKSEIQANIKQNRLNQPIRITKSQPGAYHSNVLYSKIAKNDKIKRIDRIINAIFAEKQNEFISIKSKQPLPKQIFNVKIQFPIKIQEQLVKNLEAKNQENLIPNPLKKTESKHQDIDVKVPDNRSMFAMSKQMLSQMSIRIKRRNQANDAEVNPQLTNDQRKKQRSVSPLNKKKKKFENFDDS